MPQPTLTSSSDNPSLLATLEVAVSLHKFTNIELRSQGWYAIRLRVVPDEAVRGVWMHSVTEYEKPGEKPATEMAWVADEAGRWFRSRILRIRFCHEDLLIGETVGFHVYLSNLADLAQAPLWLDIELLHQDSDINDPTAVPSPFNLKPLYREQLKVRSVACGVHSYYGCTFGSDSFGVCHMGVYASLLSFTSQDWLSQATRGLKVWRSKAGCWTCGIPLSEQHRSAQPSSPSRKSIDISHGPQSRRSADLSNHPHAPPDTPTTPPHVSSSAIPALLLPEDGGTEQQYLNAAIAASIRRGGGGGGAASSSRGASGARSGTASSGTASSSTALEEQGRCLAWLYDTLSDVQVHARSLHQLPPNRHQPTCPLPCTNCHQLAPTDNLLSCTNCHQVAPILWHPCCHQLPCGHAAGTDASHAN